MTFKTLTDCYTLQNGVKIPCIGFGTWKTPNGETTKRAVKAALEAGYRHIDGAVAYDNEASVGAAIVEYGLPRSELFITGKLFNRSRKNADVKKALNETLKDLRTDYLDLYLIHWPNPVGFRDCWAKMNNEAWHAMEELYDAGKMSLS